jgi:2,3-dimethylmalate lyase
VRARQFRTLLDSGGLIQAPGVYDAFSAVLTEQAGYQVGYVSGACSSVSHLGMPDLGLMTASEMTDLVGRLRLVTSSALIVDIDTGYGNELNVRRTVEAYAALDVAAVQLEDQVFPKRCGHLAGKAVIDVDSAVAKVRAAVKARAGSEMQIIARTDALAPLGIEEAITRGHRFVEAGADILFIEAPRSLADLELIGRSFDVPLLVNVIANSVTPTLTPEEYLELGFRIAIYPALNIAAAAAALQAALRTLRDTGLPPGDAINAKQLFDLVGLDDWLAWPDDVARSEP